MERTKLVIAIFAGAFLLQTLFFYRGAYMAPDVQMHNISGISIPRAAEVEFTDMPVKREGVVAIDFSHENIATADELNVLLSRLAARGIVVIQVQNDPLEKALRQASSLVVIAPKKSFTGKEAALVKEFVERGGRVLMIGDPTRESEINSLASYFGIMFEKDYLYNLKENEGNFRNIFVREFRQSEVTANVKSIALYAVGSVTSKDNELARVDENTLSSNTEKSRLSPIVMVEDKVLALGDLTFMTEPYNAVEHNDRFVSNIADFLANAKKAHTIADFPYFFRSEVVIMGNADVLGAAINLKNLLKGDGKSASISAVEVNTKDSLLLGLYSDYVSLSRYLDEANISISGDSVKIGSLGSMYKKDTFLLYYKKQGDRNVVILLADSKDALDKALDALENDRIKSMMLSDAIAISPSKEKEPLKPKPEANASAAK